MITKCTSAWGHKFEPRYSYAVPNMEFHEGKQSVPMGDPGAAELIMRRHQHKTYHGDVCVRCGATVKATGEE